MVFAGGLDMKILRSEEGSFVLDIFILLPAIGAFIVWLGVRHLYKWWKSSIFTLYIIALILFIAIAAGLYFDAWRPPVFLSTLSGNDFMWNYPILALTGHRIVPLSCIPTYASFWCFLNLLAIFLFFLVFYPLLLWLGIQIGYIMFGRSEKQKGAIDLLFARDPRIVDPFN